MIARRSATLLAAVAFAVAACSGDGSSAESISADESEQSAADEHPDDESHETQSNGDEQVALPDEFPAAVPIPAGLELASADVLDGERNRLFDITGWHSADPVPTGTAFLAELEELGYEVTSRTDADTSVFFIAEGEDWVVSAGFFSDPVRQDGTSVGITVSPRTS